MFKFEDKKKQVPQTLLNFAIQLSRKITKHKIQTMISLYFYLKAVECIKLVDVGALKPVAQQSQEINQKEALLETKINFS